FLTGAALAADIDLRGGIGPYQYHSKPGGTLPGGEPLLDFGCYLIANRLRNLFSVNDFGRHRSSLTMGSTVRIVAFF
ncbi:hypothetical protein G113_19628, partial [Aeromonas molluscorum 848]